MKAILSLYFLCVLCAFVVNRLDGNDKPEVLELWPGKAPNETGDGGSEKVLMSPKLDRIYRPAKYKDTGTTMGICPGGRWRDGLPAL